jgi:hypothetical protein
MTDARGAPYDDDEPATVARDELSPREMGTADAWEMDGVKTSVRNLEGGGSILRFYCGPSSIEFTYFPDHKVLATDVSADVEFVRFEGRLRFKLAPA